MCIKYSADITTYDMSIIYYKINSENDKVKWTWNYYTVLSFFIATPD